MLYKRNLKRVLLLSQALLSPTKSFLKIVISIDYMINNKFSFRPQQASVAPSRAASVLQQYDDHPTEGDGGGVEGDSGGGTGGVTALNGVMDGGQAGSGGLSVQTGTHKRSDTEDEDYDDEVGDVTSLSVISAMMLVRVLYRPPKNHLYLLRHYFRIC